LAVQAGILVSTEWLQAHLADPRLCVIDIRGQILPPGNTPRYLPKREAYDLGHIPGAQFVDWTRDIVDVADSIPVQLAKASAFVERMEQFGVSDDTLVVAYDDYCHVFAGRMAWALRFYGHDAVRILDGGWPRWVAEGRPTTPEKTQEKTQQKPSRERGHFGARPRPALRRTADEVEAALGRPDVAIVDARPHNQFVGDVSAARRRGHIPGAFNVPYASLIEAGSGKFLPPDLLARVFADSGLDPARLPREVIVYCNGGVSCTVPLVALQLLGRDDVAVYDGSWNEWGQDDARPIQVGDRR
jgi:thiosulfate/3-mercaptopyruvate sulfurtransferase